MAAADETVAFSCPGGETCPPSKARPVDLAHLGRQTLGDRALEQEILSLFVHQLATVGDKIASAGEAERRSLAHTLRGSASGVGAFPLAQCAADIEAAPGAPEPVGRLAGLIAETRDFIAAINR